MLYFRQLLAGSFFPLAVLAMLPSGEVNGQRLSVQPVAVVEPDEETVELVFTVQLAGSEAETAEVHYQTQDYTATAGQDYQPTQGTVQLSAEHPTAEVAVKVLGDRQVEGSEVFLLESWLADEPNLRIRTTGAIVTNDLGPHGGKIAFDRQQRHERSQSIYVMNADGSKLTRLTSPKHLDRVPVFNNDGTLIVFESRRDGNPEIYIMNADGTQQRRLTNHPATDGYARFSPDGQWIVFFSNRDGDYNDYILRADGSGQPRRLTQHEANDYDPCFSIDGQTIFFPSDRDGDLDLYAIPFEGGTVNKLTDTEANEHYPSVSPDGMSITFRTNRDGQYEVYTMDVDGAHPQPVTRTAESERHPAYSPDGRQIVFQQFKDYGRTALSCVDATGGPVHMLMDASAANLNGTWAPGEVDFSAPVFNLSFIDRVNAMNRRYVAARVGWLTLGLAVVAALLVLWFRRAATQQN